MDGAEDEQNIPKVFAVNEGGTRNMALACRDVGCKMMYISTDYVFNGQGTAPWQPDCKDFDPLNVYGKIKLEGEKAVAETEIMDSKLYTFHTTLGISFAL